MCDIGLKPRSGSELRSFVLFYNYTQRKSPEERSSRPCYCLISSIYISGVPRNFVVVGGGGSTNSVEDRGQGYGVGSPLVRGSGGSCNLVQEISFFSVVVHSGVPRNFVWRGFNKFS